MRALRLSAEGSHLPVVSGVWGKPTDAGEAISARSHLVDSAARIRGPLTTHSLPAWPGRPVPEALHPSLCPASAWACSRFSFHPVSLQPILQDWQPGGWKGFWGRQHKFPSVALNLKEELRQLAQGGCGGPAGSSSEVSVRKFHWAQSEITGKWERHPESWWFTKVKRRRLQVGLGHRSSPHSMF